MSTNHSPIRPYLVLPELIIKSIVDGIILTIKNDIATSVKEESILFKLFGNLRYGKFEYYEQSVNVFNKGGKNARKIRTKLSFDGDMSSFPTVYITTGRDTHKFMAVGGQESQFYRDKDTRINTVASERFEAETSIVIVSDSIEEVLLIYHVLRAMMIAALDTIQMSGIELPRIGGADIRLEEDMIPKNVFMRAMSISYEYDVRVPSVVHGMGGMMKDVIAKAASSVANDGDGYFKADGNFEGVKDDEINPNDGL